MDGTAPLVLLIEDEPQMRRFLRTALESNDYRLVEASGPDHEKSFRVEVWIDGDRLGIGEGPSRRTAETAAAAQAIERIRAERVAERTRVDRAAPA